MDGYFIGAGALLTAGEEASIARATLHAQTEEGLAGQIKAAVIDFEAIIIDGAFPLDVRRRLVERTNEYWARMDRQGLTDAVVVEGSIGRDARAIGGAALPLLAAFARDHDVLFKD